MRKRLICGEEAVTMPDSLGVCLKCIRGKNEKAREMVRQVLVYVKR